MIELTAAGTDYTGLGPSGEPDFERGWPILKALLEEATGPLTRRALLRAWPPEQIQPAASTLWDWLKRTVREGWVLQNGGGTKKDPFRYELPGMLEKWNAACLAELLTFAGPNELASR